MTIDKNIQAIYETLQNDAYIRITTKMAIKTNIHNIQVVHVEYHKMSFVIYMVLNKYEIVIHNNNTYIMSIQFDTIADIRKFFIFSNFTQN